MGFSETDSSKCRRHPNQKQLPGICSSCLRERLSRLNMSPSFNSRKKPNIVLSNSSSLSSTPPYSSTSSSTTATTTGTRKSPGSRHRRNGSEAYVSVGMVLNNGLKKSRSVSCAPLSRTKLVGANEILNEKFKSCVNTKEMEDGDNMKKKGGGFLKKLIHSTSKRTKVLMHSKTMKERSHTSSLATSNKSSQKI